MALTQVDQGLLGQYAQYTGFKNRIINGAMMIDQRNAGASGTAAGYTVDRFAYYSTQASKITWQQNAGSVTPPTGFKNYLGFTSSSAYSVLSTDYFIMDQAIEGLNLADMGFGTGAASTFTVSFWVRSSLTGTFGGAICNGANDRSYPFSFTISAANTWEQKSITVAGDTTGTWLTTNGTGLNLYISLGAGSSNTATAGAWTAGFKPAPTGATSVVGTNGATFYITGVQLEKGTTATSFDYRPYGTELALCQRYYEVLNGSGSSILLFPETASFCRNSFPYKVTKRTNATISGGTGGAEGGGTWTPLYSGYVESWSISAYYGSALVRPNIAGLVIASAEL